MTIHRMSMHMHQSGRANSERSAPPRLREHLDEEVGEDEEPDDHRDHQEREPLRAAHRLQLLPQPRAVRLELRQVLLEAAVGRVERARVVLERLVRLQLTVLELRDVGGEVGDVPLLRRLLRLELPPQALALHAGLGERRYAARVFALGGRGVAPAAHLR